MEVFCSCRSEGRPDPRYYGGKLWRYRPYDRPGGRAGHDHHGSWAGRTHLRKSAGHSSLLESGGQESKGGYDPGNHEDGAKLFGRVSFDRRVAAAGILCLLWTKDRIGRPSRNSDRHRQRKGGYRAQGSVRSGIPGASRLRAAAPPGSHRAAGPGGCRRYYG